MVWMISRKATNTNFTLFGLTRPELEHMSYHTLGEHANHYTTDMVETHQFFWDKKCTCETHMFLVMTNQNVALNNSMLYFFPIHNQLTKIVAFHGVIAYLFSSGQLSRNIFFVCLKSINKIQ
jgi:hypothetical protein